MKNVRRSVFKDKKGINDISIVAGIIFIFFITAIIIPVVNGAFGTTHTEFDTEGVVDDVRQDVDSVSSFNAFSILLTVLKLAFWDFGNSLNLPFWLDAFYSVLTVVFGLTIGRNIWIGGGA